MYKVHSYSSTVHFFVKNNQSLAFWTFTSIISHLICTASTYLAAVALKLVFTLVDIDTRLTFNLVTFFRLTTIPWQFMRQISWRSKWPAGRLEGNCRYILHNGLNTLQLSQLPYSCVYDLSIHQYPSTSPSQYRSETTKINGVMTIQKIANLSTNL